MQEIKSSDLDTWADTIDAATARLREWASGRTDAAGDLGVGPELLARLTRGRVPGAEVAVKIERVAGIPAASWSPWPVPLDRDLRCAPGTNVRAPAAYLRAKAAELRRVTS